MSFDVTTAVEPDHLRLTVSGKYSFDRVSDLIDYVKAEADRNLKKKVLIDFSGLDGNPTEADRFHCGQRLAEVLGSRIHTAIVMPVGQVTKLDEMAAVNRGAIVLVTESMAEAEAWLLNNHSKA